jgi:hypothetical protein
MSDDELTIVFTPFADKDDEKVDFYDDVYADVYVCLNFYFGSDDEAKLRLAEALIASYLKGGDFDLYGLLQVVHGDEALPPSPLDYEQLPSGLKLITDTYRKDAPPALLEEIRRLEGLVEAAVSTRSDAYFNEEQNEHRRVCVVAQNAVFGSRENLREKLKVACDALEYYAQSEDNGQAREALLFVGDEKLP